MRDIASTLRESTSLPRPKCLFYEPLSKMESSCYDGSVVCINSGCEDPENCFRYNKFMGESKNA